MKRTILRTALVAAVAALAFGACIYVRWAAPHPAPVVDPVRCTYVL